MVEDELWQARLDEANRVVDGYRTNAEHPVPVDQKVRRLLAACLLLDLRSRASCEGHYPDEIPYVSFGFAYGEEAPEHPSNAAAYRENFELLARVNKLVLRFNRSHPLPIRTRPRLELSADETEMRRIRELFSDQRAKLAKTDPGRIATQVNYREIEDTFGLYFGDRSWRDWLARLTRSKRLLRSRQAALEAFGDWLLAEALRS